MPLAVVSAGRDNGGMETADELTREDTGRWLVSYTDGRRCIVDLDANCFFPPTSDWWISKESQPLPESLPHVGKLFEGGTVRRIMELPDLWAGLRFAEGWGEWISVDYGWYPVLAELNIALMAVKPDVVWQQIKEKFGELRVAVRHHPPEVVACIKSAQAEASKTCEMCGDTETARMRTRDHWLQTLCDVCAEARGCDAVGIGDTVEELTAESTGAWLVTTQGTTHIWDMDNRTYERRPGPTTRAGAFEFDGAPQPITHVDIYPKVGGVARVWFDDPADPYRELFRQSSTVARIERVR